MAKQKNHDELAILLHHFMVLLKGLLQILIDLPGTRQNKHMQLMPLTGFFTTEVCTRGGEASLEHGLLSFFLSNVDKKGESLTRVEIKDNNFSFYLQFMIKSAQP